MYSAFSDARKSHLYCIAGMSKSQWFDCDNSEWSGPEISNKLKQTASWTWNYNGDRIKQSIHGWQGTDPVILKWLWVNWSEKKHFHSCNNSERSGPDVQKLNETKRQLENLKMVLESNSSRANRRRRRFPRLEWALPVRQCQCDGKIDESSVEIIIIIIFLRESTRCEPARRSEIKRNGNLNLKLQL